MTSVAFTCCIVPISLHSSVSYSDIFYNSGSKTTIPKKSDWLVKTFEFFITHLLENLTKSSCFMPCYTLFMCFFC